jgi:hypothetical protein
MLPRQLAGLTAGAVGTVALNTATYLDMFARARQSSGVPGEVAGRLADCAGVSLGEQEEEAEPRKTGLGVGLGYAVARGRLRRLPLTVAGPVLGLAAMAGSDVPASVLGVTDPRRWPAESWLSDLLPHLAYGFATAATYEALTA